MDIQTGRVIGNTTLMYSHFPWWYILQFNILLSFCWKFLASPSCVSKTLMSDIIQLFNIFLSYLACFRHHWLLPFELLSLTLTLPGSHRVSTKQNLLDSFSCTLFIWSEWNLMWWWSNSTRTTLDYFWVRFNETREISAVLQAASKTYTLEYIHMFRLGVMIHTIVLYILIIVSLTLTLIQGHRSERKQKLLHQFSHIGFKWFEWNLVYHRDLLVWWTSYSFYLVHSVVKGENPTYLILIKNNFNVGLYARHLWTNFF